MLRYFQLALNRFCIRQNRLYAFLGEVATPDILVILADFFLQAGEISWTIVAGIYEERLVVIFRNDGLHKNAGGLAVKAFGQLGHAGGHLASARAEIPLENLGLSPKASWQEWQNYLILRVEGRRRLPAPSATRRRHPLHRKIKEASGNASRTSGAATSIPGAVERSE